MIKPVFETAHGFSYWVDRHQWQVPAFKIAGPIDREQDNAGSTDVEAPLVDWICLVPPLDESTMDASIGLSRVLISLECPKEGRVRIFNKNTLTLSYAGKLKLRRRIGYVQSTGGLLSNRTLQQNIEYPLLIHSKLSEDERNRRIRQLLEQFGLTPIKDHRPHEIDGRARWKACAARALVTDPKLVVMEEIGDWNYTNGEGLVWAYFKEQLRSKVPLVVCLAQYNPNFIAWFKAVNGQIIEYKMISK